MFRARKSVEVPAKRSTGLLSPRAEDLLGATKRQRLSMAPYSAPSVSAIASDSVSAASTRRNRLLVDSPECAIELADALPAVVSEELRKEWPAMATDGARRYAQPPVVSCRARVPSARHRSGVQVVRVYVFVLRTKVLLWRPELRQVVSLPLPDELECDEVLQPFLLPLYGQSLSLLMIGRSGSVLFWEDIELPYDSIPLSVQIPLQPYEVVMTHADAAIGRQVNDEIDEEDAGEAASATTMGVVCWSNQGSVWEVAMDDRRLRVRAFEKQQPGLLAGLTKSVASFFFSSGSASRSSASGTGSSSGFGGLIGSGGSTTGEVDPQQPIQYAKVVPSTVGSGQTANGDGGDAKADLVVLYTNGVVERRQFSTGDVLDCSYATTWNFDASRVALAYFSDTFPRLHLAKISVVAVPYVNEARLSLLVAFVCAPKDKTLDATTAMDMETSEDAALPRVKYVLFQFAMNDGPPEPEWACVLDYEPVFSDDHQGDDQPTNRFFHVESFSITSNALYLVWPVASPIQVSTILLPHPERARQSSVRSAAFSLQGIQHQQSTFAFGTRVDEDDASHGSSPANRGVVKGSLSFLLLETGGGNQSLSGSLCVATASNMQRVERVSPGSRLRTKRDGVQKSNGVAASDLSSHFVPEHLDVEEYVGVLLAHFQRDPLATSPLRVNSQDVSTVAQAVIALDMQILDARPSSGLRWGKNDTSEQRDHLQHASELAVVTPKLVKYQLEEKRTRHVELMRFLERRCGSVWSYLEKSPELKRYLMENEEKLRAATALSKLQASILSTTGYGASSAYERLDGGETTQPATEAERIQRRLTGQFLLHAIEATVERRGHHREQLQLAGYNAFDVFYCEVSKLPELFQVLDHELDALASSIGDSDPTYLHALLESGYAMLRLIRAPPADDKQVFPATGSWAFGARQVREVLVNHVTRLSLLVGYSTTATASTLSVAEKRVRWPASDIFEMTEQIRATGGALLDSYVRMGDSEDLRNEMTFAKRAVLNPLVYVATMASATTSLSSSNSRLGSDVGAEMGAIAGFEESGAVARQRSELFAHCVRLCEAYSYYEGMVFLAYVEDRANLLQLDYILGKAPKSAALKRLESYCTTFESFDEFVYRWYAGEVVNPWSKHPEDDSAQDDAGVSGGGSSSAASFVMTPATSPASTTMFSYLLANSALFAGSLHAFMKEREPIAKYRWMTAISLDRYDHAATLALREAVNEQWSLADRKTMTSIAKIAALAAPSATSPTKESTMQRIDREVRSHSHTS